MGTVAEQPRLTESPDLYRADSEAPAYLKLPSQRAFNNQRRRVEKEHNVKIRALRSRGVVLYHREQLDIMGRLMCNVGEDD